jgi:uncharacterized protein
MNTGIKIGLQFLAIISIIVGIIGIFLPILQGFLFIILGLALFSVTSPVFKDKIDRFLHPHPKTKAHFNRFHWKISNFFKKK